MDIYKFVCFPHEYHQVVSVAAKKVDDEWFIMARDIPVFSAYYNADCGETVEPFPIVQDWFYNRLFIVIEKDTYVSIRQIILFVGRNNSDILGDRAFADLLGLITGQFDRQLIEKNKRAKVKAVNRFVELLCDMQINVNPDELDSVDIRYKNDNVGLRLTFNNGQVQAADVLNFQSYVD